MKSICLIFALTLAWTAVSAPAAFAAVPVAQPVRAAPPQITSASPSQIATSTTATTITINGSGFDASARVELMFGMGSGANEWRLPRHGFQVLSPSQIRVTVMPGTDADNLRIRVVSASGVSNLGNVRIVAPAPAPAAVQRPTIPPATITTTPQVKNVTLQPATTTQSTPALNLPAPNTTRSMATAGSTPPTLPPSQPASLPRPITYCGSPNWQRGLLQLAEVEQAVIGGYSFDVACQAHDACYRDCKRTRQDCDIQLRTLAEATCATARIKSNCATDVKWFYQVVSSRGQPAFDHARASCPISPVAGNLATQLSKPASQPATAIAPTSPVARLPVPQIAGVNPAQVQGSMRTETITVNGSGFDSGARVELMFGVGSGANEWRQPKHGFQVLSPAQIRLTVMPGTDADNLRIRVVSAGGISNLENVKIVSAAPTQSAAPRISAAPATPSANNATTATAPARSASPLATPAQPALTLTPPVLTTPSIGNMAAAGPMFAPPLPPLKISVCGNKLYASDILAANVLSVTAGAKGIEDACAAHDKCYETPPTSKFTNKMSCDGQFDREMGNACRGLPQPFNQECESVRALFIDLVIIKGDRSYSDAQAKNRQVARNISQSASQPKAVTAPPTLPSALAVNAASAPPQISKSAAQPAPKISGITPSSLPISPQMQTITINGSGFDRDTRVEWMYGTGTGVGQWRTPRNVPEVLSSTQIRVNMQRGNDPDRMQIRVVNKQGYSNVGNLTIVRSAPIAAAATALTRNASTPATPAQQAHLQAQQRVGNPAICPNLTGAARTNCLNAQLRREQQESARIDQQNRNLDTAISAVKPVDKVVGAVGGVAAAGAGCLAGFGVGGAVGCATGAKEAHELYGAYREVVPIVVPPIQNAIGNSFKP